MTRVLSVAAGVLLLVVPAWMLSNLLVPVPKYRTGTYGDYRGVALACLVLYGGVGLGILLRWGRSARRRQTMGGGQVFRAGLAGGIAAIAAWILKSALHGWLALGSWEKGVGNLWGLVLILGGALVAMVAAGAGLAWHALRGSRGEADRRLPE